jgi:hypothetical protein
MIILSLKEELYHSYKIIIYDFVYSYLLATVVEFGTVGSNGKVEAVKWVDCAKMNEILRTNF